MPPPRPTAQKPVQGNKAPGAQSVTSSMEASVSSSYGQDVPQKLHSLSPDMALARGPPHPNFGPYGPTPFILPPGVASPPFSNQLTAPLQPSYSRVSGVPQPMAPMQPPSGYVVPQQLQPGSPRGIIPVPLQMNPQNTSQMPNQSYMPTIWQKSPIVPFPIVSSDYTMLPEMRPSAVRPDLPGHALMSGGPVQHMQSSMPQSTLSQQVTPGKQYQGFSSQPGHGIMSQTPRVAFLALNQPSCQPVHVQPPVPPQSQSQQIPATTYWPTSGAHTQPGHLPFSQVSLLEEANIFPPSPLNLSHPGQSAQKQPHAHVGHAFPSIQSYQPQQMPGSIQNANKQTPLSQTSTQVPFSQNPQMPFDYHFTDNAHMPQRSALTEGNVYFQGGTSHSQGQPVPPQNMGEQPTTQYIMFQTENPPENQNFSPQTNSASIPVTVPVMDIPNPATFGGILTPSTAHTLPNNQTGSVLNPSFSENPSDRALNHDFVQDQMDKLSIASHGETS